MLLTCTALAFVAGSALAGPPAYSATAGSPNGVADAEPRWALAFRDDFNGKTIDTSKWVVYDSGERAAENVIVDNGKLKLRTKKIDGVWRPAGIGGSRNIIQTYGKYLIRAKMDAGWGVRGVALLWPYQDPWPPEVDFYEISANDPTRTINQMTVHYGPPHGMVHRRWTGNYQKWQIIGVEWTPSMLRFTQDGKVVQEVAEHVPAQKMWLALQSGLGSGSTYPNGTTPPKVDMKIDWVEIYRAA